MSFPDTFDDYLGAVSMLGDFADAAPNKIDAPAPDAFDSELDVDLQDPEVAAYLATWQPPPAVDKTSAFHPREPGPPSLFSDTSESASGQSQSMYSFAYSLLPSPSNEATLGSEFSFNMRLQDTSEYSYSPSAYGSELASSPCLDVGISEPFTSKAFNEALITASTIDFPEFGMPPPSPPLTPPSRVPLAHPARAQVPVPVPVLSQEAHSTGTRSTGARRKHICTICHRSFDRAFNLKTHFKDTHLNTKPHVCKDEGCMRAFARKHDLKRHVDAVHTKAVGVTRGERMRCDQCGTSWVHGAKGACDCSVDAK